MKYKTGDICVIKSKTSHNNGRTVEVIEYTNGRRDDIIQVKTNNSTFFICEDSLRPANKYDIIRNMKDKQLKKLLRRG